MNIYLFGGIPTPLKNINQLGWLFPIYGTNKKNVPNHQPAITGINSNLYGNPDNNRNNPCIL